MTNLAIDITTATILSAAPFLKATTKTQVITAAVPAVTKMTGVIR